VRSTKISAKNEQKLIDNGVSLDEIAEFKAGNHNMKLYEIVNLSPIGLKNKKIKEIDDCINILTDRLTESGIELVRSDDTQKQRIALATGYIQSIFRYDDASRKFFNPMHGEDAIGFNGGKHSLIDPKDGYMYIGSPFIIGHGEDTSSDFAILSQIVSVTPALLAMARAKNKSYGQDIYIPEILGGKSVRKFSKTTEAKYLP
jgi:hypothetical protein